MTTTNMSLNEPSVGQTAGPDWATEVNANFTTIDQHDHTSGKGVQLTPSALNINSDLEFNGNAAIELKRLTFDSSATGSGTNFSIYQLAGNLYWYNGSGQAVQITNGSSVKTTGGSIDNMAGTDAGVDYGAPTFRFQFDTTLSNFGAGKIAHGDILLYKYDGSSGSNAYVTLKYTGSSVGSNNLTFPDETGTLLSTATSFGGAINIDATGGSGSITLDAATSVSIEADTTITLDAEGDINLDSNSGVLTFKDNGTAIGKISNSSSDLVIENEVDAKDIIFKQYDGNEVVRMADDRRLYFFDKGGEYIVGDGTDLTVASGAAINLNAGTLDLSAQTVDVTLNAAVDALNFDSNTLSIDASNNRIGIGTAAPGTLLHLESATTSKATVKNTGDSGTELIFDANRTSAGGFTGVNTFKWNGTSVAQIAGLTGTDTTDKDDGEIAIYTKPSGGSITERMRIDSSGKVGIGTTSPGSYYYNTLTIDHTGSNGGITLKTGTTEISGIAFADGTSGNERYRGRVLYYHNEDRLALGSAGDTHLHINSSGNVGIGTTASFGGTATHKYLSILNTDGTDNLDRPAVLELACSNKGNGVHVGKIDFWSDVDGGDDNVAAIICAQEGTTSNNVGGRFRFQTKADGGSLADSMVITDEGNVGIGLTTPDRELHVRQAVTGPQAQFDGGDSGTPLYTGATSPGRGEIQLGATGGYHGAIIYTDSGGTEFFIHNNYAGSTTARVTIRAGSSGGVHIARDATSWSSSSDERMKDIHSHITGGLEKLANVRTVIASFKKSPDKKEPMLIAQDFIDILPEAVSKDPPTEHDDDGTPEDGTYTLSYTSVIPLLVNAIQELSAKVTALEGA